MGKITYLAPSSVERAANCASFKIIKASFPSPMSLRKTRRQKHLGDIECHGSCMLMTGPSAIVEAVHRHASPRLCLALNVCQPRTGINVRIAKVIIQDLCTLRLCAKSNMQSTCVGSPRPCPPRVLQRELRTLHLSRSPGPLQCPAHTHVLLRSLGLGLREVLPEHDGMLAWGND